MSPNKILIIDIMQHTLQEKDPSILFQRPQRIKFCSTCLPQIIKLHPHQIKLSNTTLCCEFLSSLMVLEAGPLGRDTMLIRNRNIERINKNIVHGRTAAFLGYCPRQKHLPGIFQEEDANL